MKKSRKFAAVLIAGLVLTIGVKAAENPDFDTTVADAKDSAEQVWSVIRDTVMTTSGYTKLTAYGFSCEDDWFHPHGSAGVEFSEGVSVAVPQSFKLNRAIHIAGEGLYVSHDTSPDGTVGFYFAKEADAIAFGTKEVYIKDMTNSQK